MLESFDQAHGLHAYAAMASSTRLLPVPAMVHGGVSHRLLWLMARRLAQQGEPVWVIDGMADEAPGQGLLGRLLARDRQAPAWGGDPDEETVPGVRIVAGRQGLLRLANQMHSLGSEAALQLLLATVPGGAHVLLTAPVEVLAVCLQGSAARPLVALDGQPRSVVEAYNVVKVLLQAGEVHPVLVPMAPGAPGPRARGGAHVRADAQWQSLDAPVQALARCARAHLGEDLQIWPVAYDDCRDTSADRVPESWWLKVLDSALVLSGRDRSMALTTVATPGAESDLRRS